MVTNRIIFFATSVQPNPEEIDYWVDLSDNPYGGSIKYFNGTEWVRLAASGGTPDLNNYYTKTQINNLLNNKADVGDVDSKVDDEEVKDVIKDVQFNTSNPNGITMVMFKYDGSNKTVSIPVASTSSAGIITSKDFLDFVKQHQLQELHTEMIDTFADIRAKYQKKLIAGLNIEIDQETNVISASGDLAVQWDNITNKPDFKPVATSGDYNDLINKLKPGKDVSISEDNTISIAIDSDSNAIKQAKSYTDTTVTAEQTRAEKAEQKLTSDLASEVTRAKGAESANATAIANEVERATGVEETLNSNITQLQTQKVDKVEGKGLSTNDYTTPEKNKLAAIEAEANKYVLPAATASALGGVKIGSNITLADGGTISITKANVTSALGVDPTTKYVTLDTDQTITGNKSFNSDQYRLPGHYYHNGYGNEGVRYIHYYSNDEEYDEINARPTEVQYRISNGDGSFKTIVFSNTLFYTMNKLQLGNDANRWGNIYTLGQLNSTVATGTAPIQVSSTTLCTNLNADMVDGCHSEHFSQNKFNKSLQTSSDKDTYFKIIELTRNAATTDSIYIKYGITVRAVSAIDYSNTTLYGDIEIFGSFSPTVVNYKVRCSSDFINKGRLRAYVNGDNLQIWYVGYIWENVATYKRIERNINHFTVNYNIELTSTLPNIDTIPIEGTQPEDWYGVSWSETSSNPDCVRIGNMDMHRSLPIQSMMKPFVITNYRHQSPENILPIDDNFSKSFYSTESNTQWEVVFSLDTDIMIRIPEFWYTDEYVPSSKTHNLKICPHAKPGWYHHKEAYVGAYELCETSPSSGKVCSAKGLIPLVGRTREVLRKAVRSSGFDGEAKWNLYTYEEHRAICHLFLVEYATRNSQKAVNTELTPEGFRRGGLGSGCTTGTATINGAQTWSFIPTGSSDSLGSGSGEVTVTIQQTDSSGSNTSTITRKCNRYRGIENPFGHIWKHTDDVISVYGNGHRTWYKSVKPNQFATNKNTSYKPFCASTMVSNGYKTEIKATPTCDFFATSVSGGSETTYWCDYNWDNTDTSEHCLLIGGYSGDGGGAGLFYLHSYIGVGASGAAVGSRLTYLPWAE